jgi:hypothetical protein
MAARNLGIQVAPAEGSAEHRSERIVMRERGAQKLTHGWGRMGPKGPPTLPVAGPLGK